MPLQMTQPETGESTATVGARCTDCGDEHPLGDRPLGDVTTHCPHCKSTSYETLFTGDPITKPDDERITDVVRGISGVGDQTLENILTTFDAYYEFEAASRKQLESITGVGTQIATEILNRR